MTEYEIDLPTIRPGSFPALKAFTVRISAEVGTSLHTSETARGQRRLSKHQVTQTLRRWGLMIRRLVRRSVIALLSTGQVTAAVRNRSW